MASTCTGVIEVSTIVRGYYAYQEIWSAPLGEVLFCQRETDNRHDRFAVAIVKESEVVGHVRREISSICSVFLLSGTITCEVTGSRQYSFDLDQGGVEIPCKLRFTCSDQELLKTTRKLLDIALKKDDLERPLKKIKLEPVEELTILLPSTSQPNSHPIPAPSDEVITVSDNLASGSSSQFRFMAADIDTQWVKTSRTTLLNSHKTAILDGNLLDDTIINFAQKLLKKQFPNINGLQNTLLQAKKQINGEKSQRMQVIHCRSNHWILASTVHDDNSDRVMIYDSLYDNVDPGTLTVIRHLFGPTVMPEFLKYKSSMVLQTVESLLLLLQQLFVLNRNLSFLFTKA